jgi:homogentisate 1,2-dioxygenase
VPQQGVLTIVTELGVLTAGPGEIAVIPRGVRFRVEVDGAVARLCLRELWRGVQAAGPGADRLERPGQSARLRNPGRRLRGRRAPTQVIQKFQGGLWASQWDHSPLDVVAWHGNLAPCKYDLSRFNTINTVSFDHPDPSIFTVLTSPSEIPGTANCDFVIFPPRWMVAEHTFRPPWFHRNVMSEFMGLVTGAYDAKAGGFSPGGASLHNCDERSRPRSGQLSGRGGGRSEAAQDREHPGLHVRKPMGDPPHAICSGAFVASGGL